MRSTSKSTQTTQSYNTVGCHLVNCHSISLACTIDHEHVLLLGPATQSPWRMRISAATPPAVTMPAATCPAVSSSHFPPAARCWGAPVIICWPSSGGATHPPQMRCSGLQPKVADRSPCAEPRLAISHPRYKSPADVELLAWGSSWA